MDFQKVLLGVLKSAYRLKDEEIAELLQQDAENVNEDEVLNAVLELDKTRTSNYGKTKFDDGFKKAQKELFTSFENDLKSKYQIDADLRGTELIEAIVSKHVQSDDKQPKITEDVIKSHPLFIGLESQLNQVKNSVETEKQKAIQEIENNYKKKAITSSVKENWYSILNSGKFVLPEDANIAKNQINAYSQFLDQVEWGVTDDGKRYPIKDGARLEDQHGNALFEEDYLTHLASQYFPIKQSNGGSNAGNNNNAGMGENRGGQAQYNMPKTIEEMEAFVRNPNVPKEIRDKAIEEFTTNQ